MSRIAEFRAAELALGKQLAAFEALKNSHELKRELEFDSALTRLLSDYGVDRDDLPGILGLTATGYTPRAPKAAGEKRAVKNHETAKTFHNPHTNETITIKRLTHGTYKQWVAEYGEVIVHTWKV